MRCSYCGQEMDANSRFCPSCGKSVVHVEAGRKDTSAHFRSNSPEMTAADLPQNLKPLGAWAYFGYSLLFAIPIVGFIILCVFALGGTNNINLKNFARSYFCVILFWLIVALIVLAVTGITLASLIAAVKTLI